MGSDDAPRTLAVRRAVLTIGLDLVECCDDSYGHLGDVINEALDAYAGTDWRSAGVPPTVFWPDFLEIFTMLSNYSIMHSREADVFRRAGVAQDLDDVVGAATGLHADYTAARMSWEASLVRELYAHAIIAADAPDRLATHGQLRRLEALPDAIEARLDTIYLRCDRDMDDSIIIQERSGRRSAFVTRMGND